MKKAIRKAEICKKQAQKTSKFQLKQAQKQATRKSSKKTQLHKKTSPNSRDIRKVGNTATQSYWRSCDYIQVSGSVASHEAKAKLKIACLNSNSNFAVFTESKFTGTQK